MSFNATCPECEESVRLRDEVEDSKIECSNCGKRFIARSRSSERDEDEEESRSTRQKKRSKRRDEDDPPKRRRRVEQVATPIAPLIWGILSILLPCPVIGLAIAGIAIFRALAVLG